ncbi:MAG: succinylglutamate desuccinylase, partial [Rhodospirillaceae bacterium]
KRLRDHGGFGEAAATQNALLVEAGQHWRKETVDCSMDVTFRFLRETGAISADDFARHADAAPPPAQRFIEVSGPHTIQGDTFDWANRYTGMELIETAGTVIGWDGGTEVVTPYDNCVLVMPNRLKTKGHSAVRFGRLLD